MEAEKSKIRVPADSIPCEDSLPGLQTATFLLGANMAFPQGVHMGRDFSRFLFS